MTPADGDCLLWTLRLHSRGIDHVDKCASEKADREVRQMRRDLAELWLSVKHERKWQTLFREMHAADMDLSTPPRKKKKPQNELEGEAIDLSTPPRPEAPPEKRRRKDRVGQARPVQFQRAEDDSLKLKPPGADKHSILLEPVVPDMEDAIHKANQRQPQVESQCIEVEEENNEAEQKKKPSHKRRWKCRVKTEREALIDKLSVFLGQKGLNYDHYRNIHRLRCPVSKAWVCPEGGYKAFKEKLLNGELPQCPVCCELLKKHGVDLEGIEACKSDQFRIDISDHEGEAEGAAPDAEDQESELAERQRCIDFVKSHEPIIQLVEGADCSLKYKCTICKTASFPDGRENALPKLRLKDVKHFLRQHLVTPKHQRNLQRSSGPAEPDTVAPQVFDCEGYVVSNPRSPGWDSFKMFQMYSKSAVLNL